MTLLECFDHPLSMLPGVIVLCILRQDDLSESQLAAWLLKPLDQYPTVLPD